jgi:hypothetical protein
MVALGRAPWYAGVTDVTESGCRMAQLRIRLEDELQSRLEESARKRGGSLQREIAERLAASFAGDALERPAGPVGGLLDLVAIAAQSAGHGALLYASAFVETATEWTDDRLAYEQATLAAQRVFEALRPPKGKDQELAAQFGVPPADLGVKTAAGILDEIANNRPRVPESVRRTNVLRQELGPELINRLQTALKSKERSK